MLGKGVAAEAAGIEGVAGVTGVNTNGASLALISGGNITQSSPVTNVSALAITASGSIDLDEGGVSNTITSLGAISDLVMDDLIIFSFIYFGPN